MQQGIEKYNDVMGSDREKRQVNCRNSGHNKLTCKNGCSTFHVNPYCEHLINIIGSKVPICQQENALYK